MALLMNRLAFYNRAFNVYEHNGSAVLNYAGL